MRIVNGLAEALRRLDRTDLRAAKATALEAASAILETAVKLSLSHLPGEDHSAPWLRTGALRDSIVRTVEENTATIASTDLVAVYQELGTRTLPPRPFLAATAATEAQDIVQTIADAIAAACEAAE